MYGKLYWELKEDISENIWGMTDIFEFLDKVGRGCWFLAWISEAAGVDVDHW